MKVICLYKVDRDIQDPLYINDLVLFIFGNIHEFKKDFFLREVMIFKFFAALKL
jgi:hypothetical protein